MPLRALAILVVLLMATSTTAGCLSQAWEALGGHDEGHNAHAAPGEGATADAADEPIASATYTIGDDTSADDHWQRMYDAWSRCPREGGPIDPCPHPHPVTESPATGPQPQRISARHDVTPTNWTATIHAVDEPIPYPDLRLDFASPDTGGSLYNRDVPADGLLHFTAGRFHDCVDCGIYQRMTPEPYPIEERGYRMRITDHDADRNLTPGDSFTIEYDASTTSNHFGDPFPHGRYTLRLEATSTTTLPPAADTEPFNSLVTTSDMRAPGWNVSVRHDFGTDTQPITHVTLELPDLSVHIPLDPESGANTQTHYIDYGRANRWNCTDRDACTSPTPPARGPAFRITLHDTNGDGHYTIGDHITVDHDMGNRSQWNPRTWNHPFPFGDYRIDLHDTRGAIVATANGTVHDGRTPG